MQYFIVCFELFQEFFGVFNRLLLLSNGQVGFIFFLITVLNWTVFIFIFARIGLYIVLSVFTVVK